MGTPPTRSAATTGKATHNRQVARASERKIIIALP
ncbi:hypothetical protein IL54_4394 [Sphingobium sp. ba1]|nr:hypothetical protein IL54_4394 [Sphingobium sp. ba1]